MSTTYEEDVVAWSREQAALLRMGKIADLDIEHIADEIEDVAKSELRDLANRIAVLLATLLKWSYQSERRSSSWESIIHRQRNSIECRIHKTPSLKAVLADPDWWADAWDDAIIKVIQDVEIADAHFPDTCLWEQEQVMNHGFLPE